MKNINKPTKLSEKAFDYVYKLKINGFFDRYKIQDIPFCLKYIHRLLFLKSSYANISSNKVILDEKEFDKVKIFIRRHHNLIRQFKNEK